MRNEFKIAREEFDEYKSRIKEEKEQQIQFIKNIDSSSFDEWKSKMKVSELWHHIIEMKFQDREKSEKLKVDFLNITKMNEETQKENMNLKKELEDREKQTILLKKNQQEGIKIVLEKFIGNLESERIESREDLIE